MTALVWTRRAIEDVQSIQRFIEKDSPHYAQLVGQQLVAAVERLPTFPQSGRVVPEFNNPAIREVIQGSYRIVYRLIHGESIFLQFTTPPACCI
jgi:plasmid stabilization system protein ParE